jgi:hypothetical protein
MMEQDILKQEEGVVDSVERVDREREERERRCGNVVMVMAGV